MSLISPSWEYFASISFPNPVVAIFLFTPFHEVKENELHRIALFLPP